MDGHDAVMANGETVVAMNGRRRLYSRDVDA